MDAPALEQRRKTLNVGLNMVFVVYLYCILVAFNWCSLLVLGISIFYTINAAVLYREGIIEFTARQQLASRERHDETGSEQVPEDE